MDDCCNRGGIQFPSRFSIDDIIVNSFHSEIDASFYVSSLLHPSIMSRFLYTPLISKLNTSVASVRGGGAGIPSETDGDARQKF